MSPMPSLPLPSRRLRLRPQPLRPRSRHWRGLAPLLVPVALLAACSGRTATPTTPAGAPAAAPAATAAAEPLVIAPDVPERLAKFAPTPLTADLSVLPAGERQVLA